MYNNMKIACLVMAGVLLVAPAAYAADDEDDAPKKEAPKAEPAKTDAVSTEGIKLARVPAADESIYVTQLRAFSKKGHLEITPIFGAVLNTRFVSTIGLYGGITYHFKENFALEAFGGYSGPPFSRYTEATVEINTKENLEAPNADRKWMDWFAGVDVQWSPFYGKLRLIPGVLATFDVYLLGGFGLVGTRAPCSPNATYLNNGQGEEPSGNGVQGITGTCPADPVNAALPAGVKFAGQFGAGARVFFARWFGVRLEIRDIIYSENVTEVQVRATGREESVSTDIRNNVMLIVGLSFLI